MILPNSLPGIIVAGLFCLIFGWNDFFFAFTLTFTQTQLLPVAVVALNSSVTPWWSFRPRRWFRSRRWWSSPLLVEKLPVARQLAGAIR